MKKLFVIIVFFIFAFQSCNNEDEVFIPQQEVNEIESVSFSKTGLHPCGSTVTGSYSPKWGNHFYPTETFTTPCSESGGTITITVNASTSPNTFLITDGNGNTVAYSDWIGYSSSPGPWGSSLNGPSTRTYIFPKTTQTYQLEVFTITQGWGDTWSASFSCQNVCPPPPSDCGTSVSGSFNTKWGNHFYPDEIIDVASVNVGDPITITVNAQTSPNTFDIEDANGYGVASSGWMGYSSQWGPWGSSLNGPYSKTFTFPKVTDTYKIKVFTITQGWGDTWSASIGCQP